MTTKNDTDRAGPLMDQLNAAIRENPLAAGLIGAGVAWMLFGGPRGFGVVASGVSAAGRKAGSAANTAGAAVAGGLTNAGSAVASGLKAAGSQITDAIPSIVPDLPESKDAADALTGMKSAVKDGLNAATSAGKDYGVALQSRLSESLERQPLLLGAIGLAIGAGVAATFAATKAETELMGGHASAMREKLQDLTSEVKDRAQQVVADVKDEAMRQGLTGDAAMKAAAGIGDKVKTVAGAGRDTVGRRFSGN